MTYSTLGSPAKEVLDSIEKMTGRELRASLQTQDDLLVIQVKKVPVSRLLDEIAWSVSGSWQREGNALVLTRTGSDSNVARQRSRAWDTEQYRIGLAKFEESLKKQGPFNADAAGKAAEEIRSNLGRYTPQGMDSNLWTAVRSSDRKLPLRRALSKLLALLSPEELADLPIQIPVIYSDQPTVMERPLGSAARNILSEYAREQALWLEVALQRKIEQTQLSPDINHLFGVPTFEERRPAARCLMSLTRFSGHTGSVLVLFTLLDEQGRVLERASESIDRPIPALKSPSSEEAMTLPRETAEVLEALRKDLVLPPNAVQALSNPESIDPLSYLLGPVLRSYVAAKKANLVGAVKDPAFWTAISFNPLKPTVRDVETSLARQFESKSSGGWISIRPRNWAFAEQGHCDRRVLGAFLRRQLADPPLTFEEKANWTYQLPLTRYSDQMPDAIAAAIRRREAARAPRLITQQPEMMLRLYGSLTSDQRTALRSRALLVRDLSIEQSQILWDLTYGSGGIQSIQRESQPLQVNHLTVQTLPHESLPNGIDPDSRLTFSEESESYARVAYHGSQDYSIMNVAAVTHARIGQLHPDLALSIPERPYDLDRIQIGKRTVNSLAIRYTADLYMKSTFTDERLEPKPYAYQQLPEEFQADFKRMYDLLKTNRRAATPTSTGTSSPPPPRP